MKKTHYLVHHRFHDNIAHLVEILQHHGFQTKLFVILKTNTETYSLAEPIILPVSCLSGFWKKFVKRQLQSYLPSFRSVLREYRKDKPEYVLLRPLVSGIGLIHFICALWYCKKIVLYSQSPKFRASNFKNDFILKLVLAFPKTVWMTPVLYRDPKYLKGENSPHRKIQYVQLPHKRVEKKSVWFKDDRINILLVAKAQSYKNHKVLINALANLPLDANYHLSIAGDYSGNDGYTREIIELLRLKEIKHEILGYVAHDFIGDLYRAHDLLVLPSAYEMHGYAVNEAIAFGVPVVVSSNVGTICLVENEKNGFVFESENEAELTAILLHILSNRNQLKTMSLACATIFEEKLSEEVFSQKYLKLLE
ncbi:MAG: glycosyltransferase involved in cell wall biosynthesis [Parvicella sp.]